jgi:hypothetical protein
MPLIMGAFLNGNIQIKLSNLPCLANYLDVHGLTADDAIKFLGELLRLAATTGFLPEKISVGLQETTSK